MTLLVGSLFSGIGGFDLGLERAGMQVVWQCEADAFCWRVLAEHWPGVPCYEDVRELTAANVQPIDVLCGGFPCQDISVAGRGAGIDGERSGLWGEYARLVRELRPRYVIVENVAALLGRGLERVLGDLAACGYDAEWDCIPAAAVGAPHRRDRLWLIAYPNTDSRRLEERGERDSRQAQPGFEASQRYDADRLRSDVADADRTRFADVQGREAVSQRTGGGAPGRSGWWDVEPDVGRVADGVPARVDRLRSLGNALVPQIAEWLGGRILDYEADLVTELVA